MYFDIATSASIGARRSQEDAAIFARAPSADREGGANEAIAVLADGMGGHIGGAIASRIACDEFLKSCTSQAGVSADVRLMVALDTANRALAEAVDETPSNAGMGCTLIGVQLSPAGIHWISVGDSLLYLWRRGGIATLNADHSLAPEIDRLAEAGRISWDEARTDPRRHYLRSAVTGEELELIDNPGTSVALGAGDVIVIASDGLDTLNDDTIANVIANNREASANAVANALIAAVEAAKAANQDNTTVIAIRVIESPDEVATIE